ncbi:MAG: TetR/AcrR family transcriptional regulator [Patescibacteria group bacterium]
MSKDKILQVSERLFFAKTYSDVKLDVIANELNIQKPSLYHYFKDKKDLFSQTINFSMANYL